MKRHPIVHDGQLSLLDTAGMKVRDWYVCYDDRPAQQHWLFRYMKPNFRHVELTRAIPYGPGVSDVGWMSLMPRVEMLDMELSADPRPPWERFPVVQRVTAMRRYWSTRSHFDIGPPTCVEAVKWALGVRAFAVRTPWQLHGYIALRNGILRGN